MIRVAGLLICDQLNKINVVYNYTKTGGQHEQSNLVYKYLITILINIGDEKICILLYAEDIVLLTSSKTELQVLLSALSDWYATTDIIVNSTNSKIVHFRPQSVQRTYNVFLCGEKQLDIVDKYTYLDIVLNEHLDYCFTAKTVAQSANFALGLLIAKCKIMGGLPYDAFTKLYMYDSVVWPIINHGTLIWGLTLILALPLSITVSCDFSLGLGSIRQTMTLRVKWHGSLPMCVNESP